VCSPEYTKQVTERENTKGLPGSLRQTLEEESQEKLVHFKEQLPQNLQTTIWQSYPGTSLGAALGTLPNMP